MSIQNKNTLYLVRHGENPANITHEFTYKYVDYSLTPKGMLQAEQTAEYFTTKHIDEIYASPLKRARETAEIIGKVIKLPVTIVEQFREINVGSLEMMPPTDENWQLHNRIVQDWFEGKNETTFPDGENYYTLLGRMRSGLLETTRGKSGQQIVIVGHGGIFARTMRDICPTLDMKELMRVEYYNCAISEIELTTTDEQVEGMLKVWASYAHLHGEAAQVVIGSAPFGKLEESKLQ